MADEPERRIAGAILLELEEQAKNISFNVSEYGPGKVMVTGVVDVVALTRAVLAGINAPPPKPVLKTREEMADFAREWDRKVEEGWSLWEVDMKPRNVANAIPVTVQVKAGSRKDAISNALSVKPGHVWGEPRKIG